MVMTDQDMNLAYSSRPRISKREKAMIQKFTIRTLLHSFVNLKIFWSTIISPKAEMRSV